MKTENTFGTSSIELSVICRIICYSCGIPEHQACECHKNKGKKL